MVVSPRVHRIGLGPLRRAYDHYLDASGRASRALERFRGDVASAGLGVGQRLAGAEHPESHGRGAESEAVAVGETDGAVDLLPPHRSAVAAAQVLDHRLAVGDHDARVAPGDRRGVDPHHRLTVPAEEVLALPERDLAVAPDEPADALGAPAGGRAGRR